MSQQFCLKWNNHTTNMLQVFENLLTTEALVDVTLACDGLSLKAHKMVLSACSPFFQSLFLENPCKHPIVIMKDMRYCDLKAIIDFMYRGEVNVSHDQLSALLKTAETLKVKGLAEVTGENKQASGIVQHEIIQQNASTPIPIPTPIPTPVPPSAQRTDTPPLQGKRKRGRPRKRSLSDSNRSDDEGVPPKIKETNSDIEELSGDASMDATSDNRSSGGPVSCNSQSQVPIHSSNNVNTFSKSHLSTSQDPQVEEPASGDENEFEVEPSKLLEQTLTTENVPSNSHNSTGPITLPSVSGLEISRRSMSSTDSGSQALVPVSIPSDSLGSNVQAPDSPQDVKPQILSFDDPPISPVAGTSHGSDRSLMMYMDQSGVASIPGPSNFQDNSALVPHDSQPQDKHRYSKLKNKCTKKKDKNILESIGLFQELPEDPICVYHEHADDNICNEIDLTHDEEVVLEKSRRKSGSRKQLVPSKLVCNTDGKDQAIESNLTENKNNTTKRKPGETEKHISDANFMASAMKNMTLSEELRKPEEDSVPKRPSNPGTKRKKLNAKNPGTESHPKNSDTVDKQKPKRARKSAFIAADFIFGLSRPFKQLEKGSKQYGKKQASKKHPKHDKEKVEKRESIINAQSSVLKKVQNIAKTSTVSESSECPAENNNATELPEPEKQNVPATRFGVKNIPEGWQRQIIVRKGGKSAGQFDIYFFSPDGTKLRSRRDVAEYLAKTKSNLRVEDFDFRKKVISNNCSIKLSSSLEDDLRRENTKKT